MMTKKQINELNREVRRLKRALNKPYEIKRQINYIGFYALFVIETVVLVMFAILAFGTVDRDTSLSLIILYFGFYLLRLLFYNQHKELKDV